MLNNKTITGKNLKNDELIVKQERMALAKIKSKSGYGDITKYKNKLKGELK